MFCPQCRSEYVTGVTRCDGCGVELVATLAEPTREGEVEWTDLVTVLETADSARVSVVKSLLEAEGIPCATRGDPEKDLTGLDLIAGPARVLVPPEFEEQARDLIATPMTGALAGDEAALEGGPPGDA